MSILKSVDSYLETKSDEWLSNELKEAVAIVTDATKDNDFRESALAAATMMSAELLKRKEFSKYTAWKATR